MFLNTGGRILFDSIINFVFFSQIENVVDIVELVVISLHVIFKSLELEVDFESLLPADVTV